MIGVKLLTDFDYGQIVVMCTVRVESSDIVVNQLLHVFHSRYAVILVTSLVLLHLFFHYF